MPRTALFRKAFALTEVKLADDATSGALGVFSGYLAVFGNVDLGDDVIEPGAFTKTLQEARERKDAHAGAYLFPILYQHDQQAPCGGFLEAREDAHGLWVKGQLDLDTQLGRDTYSGLKKGYLSGLSIGYSAIKHKWVGQIRHLQELALFEGSVVTFPMNTEATVAMVKTGVGADGADRKAASGNASWPLADRDAAWDGADAHTRIVAWATKADGSYDTVKLQSVHFWYDASAPDKLGSYKLLFCDTSGANAAIQAIPRGIFACAGSHGVEAADIPDGDVAGVKDKIAAYYARMAKQFDDDTIVAPWAAKAQSDGGKGMQSMTRTRTRRKARDFNSTLTMLQESDTLQEDWHDTFQALVSSLCGLMWDAKYPSYGVSDGQDAPDPADAGATILDQFAAAMGDLIKRSLAASFAPMLDDDGDSFDDPDDEDDDDAGGYESMGAEVVEEMKRYHARRHPASGARRLNSAFASKEGRTLSADNHALMTKALGMIGEGHKALTAFVKSNAPDAASAADPAPKSNPGDEPPSQSDNVYDPGFGKSAAAPAAAAFTYRRQRAGAQDSASAASAQSAATTLADPAGQASAGAQGSNAAGMTMSATTHNAATMPPSDEDVAAFHALLASMRLPAASTQAASTQA